MGEEGAARVTLGAPRLGPAPTPEQIAGVTPQQVAAARLARTRQAAGPVMLGSPAAADAATRAAVSAVLTVVNSLHEYWRARHHLAAQGNWEPTAGQVAAAVTALRDGEAVDPTAPTPAEVAALFGGGRVPAATYRGIIAAFIAAGAGDPTTP